MPLNLLRYNKKTFIGGGIILIIITIYILAIWKLINFSIASKNSINISNWVNNVYFRQVLWFSTYQALICAILAVVFGVLLARSFFYLQFKGKKWILNIFSLTFVLPSLVVVFALLEVWGYRGWISQIFQVFNLDFHSNIYGLKGIILAHLFFNFPFASNLFLQALHSIPPSQFMVAQQLNLRGFKFFRWVEWHYIKKQILPTLMLVFMLCFSSFTIVLTLGGNPKFTTLEVAIYQSVFFEFNLPQAGRLALLQGVICLTIFTLNHSLNRPLLNAPPPNFEKIFLPQNKQSYYLHWLVMGSAVIFILPPLASVVSSVIFSGELLHRLQNSELWRALAFSISFAICGGCLAVSLATGILLWARDFWWRKQFFLANQIINSGMLILALPSLVLSLGIFLGLRQLNLDLDSHCWILWLMVVICNAMLSLPFALRVLNLPFYEQMVNVHTLCESLSITGFARWRWIEFPALKRHLKYSFAITATITLGDFTAIAMLGNSQLTSLPMLLYTQLSSYQMADASVTAFILFVFCYLLFNWGKYD